MKVKNRSKYPTQKRLLSVLYKRAGGLAQFAKRLAISPQLAFFWREQGYIPLKRVPTVAKALKVSPYALNYKGYKDFTGADISWHDTVRGCKLSKDESKHVLGD